MRQSRMPARMPASRKRLWIFALALLLTIPAAANAQEPAERRQIPEEETELLVIEPVIEPLVIPFEALQPQIQACLEDDPLTCPIRERLTIMRAAVAEMDRLIGQIGLFCELNPADCPAMAEVDRLHGLNQAVNGLAWGLPRHKIEVLRGQRPVIATRPEPPGQTGGN